ncbi:MAG: hypothetical protein H6597_03660 [Flavobacteriales bacterium]|nr:hypothetical protein [Flavobacteriales bacterium]MCB9193605.1 hypothetical protein [Flavobacteriales bacterium]
MSCVLSSRCKLPCLSALPMFFGALLVHAQVSPFNGRAIPAPDSAGRSRVLIGGHFHGSSMNRSGFPAATLLANLDTINKLGADVLLSTGDLFLDPEHDRVRYRWSLFDRLRMPMFNAPGNHDVVRGEEVGPQMLRMGRTIVLLLNSEAHDGDLSPSDLAVLDSLDEWSRRDLYDRAFIVSHRPIWAEEDARYSALFKGNTRSITGTNFDKAVRPRIERIARRLPLFWISGSMGGAAPASFFFQPQGNGVTYIQSAIRDEPRDALLIADLFPDSIHWSSFSLTGRHLMDPREYDAAWWRANLGQQETFNWRLLPYLVRSTVLRSEFWWGVLLGAMLVLIARWLFRRAR